MWVRKRDKSFHFLPGRFSPFPLSSLPLSTLSFPSFIGWGSEWEERWEEWIEIGNREVNWRQERSDTWKRNASKPLYLSRSFHSLVSSGEAFHHTPDGGGIGMDKGLLPSLSPSKPFYSSRHSGLAAEWGEKEREKGKWGRWRHVMERDEECLSLPSLAFTCLSIASIPLSFLSPILTLSLHRSIVSLS